MHQPAIEENSSNQARRTEEPASSLYSASLRLDLLPLSTYNLKLTTYNRELLAPLATLFHPWHANASANTFSPIFTGAKRSRAPFAFRRIPPSRSRRTISIAGSKLAQDMVK